MEVKVYRNSHKKCWSIKEGKLPVKHATQLLLYNCLFHVSQSGRLRVLWQKKKNVHAWIKGTIVETIHWSSVCMEAFWTWKEVKYNPYKSPCFVYDNNKPIYSANKVFFNKEGKVYVKN